MALIFRGKIFSSVTVNGKETKIEKEFTDIDEYTNYIKKNYLEGERDSIFSWVDSFSLPEPFSEFKNYENELRYLEEDENIRNKKISRLQSFRDRFKKLGREDRVKEIDEKIESLKK